MEGLSDYEKIRLESMKMLDEFWEKEMDDADLASCITEIHEPATIHAKKHHRRKNADSTYLFTGPIPTERRSSGRLKKELPEFTYLDLDDDELLDGQIKERRRRSGLNKENLKYLLQSTGYIKRPRSIRRSTPVTKPVEEITDAYIRNIATKGTCKVYSENGTSCHQCRQKTLDSKTYCRNPYCHGIRGQFCGPCLLNRYGEIAAMALKNPNWKCPPCRNECNCSICRNRIGMPPTGILAPVAQSAGFRSVRDMLRNLEKLGINPKRKDLNMKTDVPKDTNFDSLLDCYTEDDDIPYEQILSEVFPKIDCAEENIMIVENPFTGDTETFHLDRDEIILGYDMGKILARNQLSDFNTPLLGFELGVPFCIDEEAHCEVDYQKIIKFYENKVKQFKSTF